MDRVRIFDTTLRDGEQSAGGAMTAAEKLEVARSLASLGVDVIEAGFPAASPGDLQAVRAIAEEVGRSSHRPIIAGLARATQADIDACWEGVRLAERPRIHTFIATSDVHMKHKLRLPPGQVLERLVEAVKHARNLCDDVEFSAEDATRSDRDFLCRVVELAIKAGATTINLPDTVGYTTPDEYGDLIRGILERVPGADRVILSVHCHDDLGMAVANTLAALKAGARQAECTINGIGERAGNCALEEVVMALYVRKHLYQLETGIDTTQLVRASRLVSTCTGMLVQPNKAVVGQNAFAHESGIHQDGMLKHAETYEIMRPETVGAGPTKLVLGKLSGANAFATRLRELGYPLEGDELKQAFEKFKLLADKKKTVTDADLEALIADALPEGHTWVLDGVQVGCGTTGIPTASVRLRGPDGETRVAAAVGTGPVDSTFKAVDEIVATPVRLLEYSVHSVTEGIDALAQVSVRVRAAESLKTVHPQKDGREPVFHGHGTDTDIVVASVKAYVAALNRVIQATATKKKAEARHVESTDAVRSSLG